MKKAYKKIAKRQSGVALLESLIAMVILSLGLVGIASTMLTSMRNNDATLSRTNSTMLANEIYEKILANMPGAIANNYNLSMNATLPDSTNHNCANTGANCSVAQLAEWDIALWGARSKRILPRADAAIHVHNTVDPIEIAVSIRFDALREIDGRTTEIFTFRAR